MGQLVQEKLCLCIKHFRLLGGCKRSSQLFAHLFCRRKHSSVPFLHPDVHCIVLEQLRQHNRDKGAKPTASVVPHSVHLVPMVAQRCSTHIVVLHRFDITHIISSMPQAIDCGCYCPLLWWRLLWCSGSIVQLVVLRLAGTTDYAKHHKEGGPQGRWRFFTGVFSGCMHGEGGMLG